MSLRLTCRGCRGVLDSFLNLGELQLSGYLAPGEGARPKVPLQLCACAECGLVQLGDTTPPALLFEQYWYRSGVNEVMQDELQDVVERAEEWVRLAPLDAVLDIGANDGTLLRQYHGKLTRVAYEPATNLQAQLLPWADCVFDTYFPDRFDELQAFHGRFKIITSIAMFYAVDDVHRFLTAVAALLHRDGVWIVQFQDLANMLRATAFDNICHEHLCYYSLQTFEQLLKPYGLQVIAAEERPINGGSLRLTVAHAGSSFQGPSVGLMRQREAGCQDWSQLERFAWRVTEVVRQINTAVSMHTAIGQTVDLYGASTKANTLLQVCGLTGHVIRQAWERSPEKVGRRTAGSDIPIVSEEMGRIDPPDALLVGIWQFRNAVLQREHEYLERGKDVIFPLPAVDIVHWRKVSDVHA